MGVHSWTGPIWQRGVTGCNAWCRLVICGELTNSSTFAATQDSVSAETLALGGILALSFSTVFITPDTG